MVPLVEIAGHKQILTEGSVNIDLGSSNPTTVVFEDTDLNRNAIDKLRSIKSNSVKPTSISVIPDEKGDVTFGIQRILLPKGYRINNVRLNEFGFEIQKQVK